MNSINLIRLQASIVLLWFGLQAACNAQDGYAISRHQIGGGGGVSSDGIFTLSGIIGQPNASVSTNADGFQLTSGYGQSFAPSPDFLFGQSIVPLASLGADLSKAPDISPPQKAFYVPEVQKVFSSEPGYVYITWKETDGTSLPTATYLIGGQPVRTPVSLYQTDAAGTPGSVLVTTNNYSSWQPIPVGPLLVSIPSAQIPNVKFHTNYMVNFNGSDPGLAVGPDGKLHSKLTSGLIILEYRDPTGAFLDIEIVQLKSLAPEYLTASYIGDQLSPAAAYTNAVAPYVSKGTETNSVPTLQAYAYQHHSAGSPQDGQVYAIQKDLTGQRIEVYWQFTGAQGIVWPYELHRYTADWPMNVPGKYQLYACGSLGNLGKSVSLSSSLNTALMPYQEPSRNVSLNGTTFFSTQPASPGSSGWSLLQYTPSNSVAFQVVRSVAHNDTNYFSLSPNPWPIGSEIVDNANPVASRFGYIYAPPDKPAHDWDRYDFGTYAGTNNPTGQIFAVNKGNLEVWWSTTNAWGTAWPTIAMLYTNWWPAKAENVVIASQNGTPPFNSGPAYAYYQNDPTQAGFNPNEEHVWTTDGHKFFPLRCDLNQTNDGPGYTSAPYILIKSPNVQNPNLWQYTLFGVLAEGTDWTRTNYTLSYSAGAGQELIEPTPLNTLDASTPAQTMAVSGPWWRGTNTTGFWARAAGDDGVSTAKILMQYYYRVQDGFYFPDAYLTNSFVTNLFASYQEGLQPTNTPPGNMPFPWLDLYAGTPGTPANYTFVVSWLPDVPVLRFGETLFASKDGLPAVANAGTNWSVVYEQSYGTAGVHSAQFILPTNAVSVFVPKLPTDIQPPPSTNLNYLVFFPGLPSSLRQRVWWDGNTSNLVFSGSWVTDPILHQHEPQGYLLLNVITPQDKASLLGLATKGSADDIAFQSAIQTLAEQAAQVMLPGNTNARPDSSVALTAGNARAGGYVTVAHDVLGEQQPLTVIEVGCPSYVGDVEVVPNSNPFDPTQTLQYSGDFGGNAGKYHFYWERAISVGSQPTTFIPFADGPGLINVSIAGSGPDVLVDHFFRCRYQLMTNAQGQALCPSSSSPPGLSDWSGTNLVPGWIGQVTTAIDPLSSSAINLRFSSYQTNTVDTIASMLALAGRRWIGNVALDSGASNLGLIEAYETVLKIGKQLSIDNLSYDPSDPVLSAAVDTALMDAAGRLSDLYMLLGNEAYAEATDPTISFGDKDTAALEDVASSVFCFEGDPNAPTLLDQELALLHGRDDVTQPEPPVTTYPVYNRLYWNTSDLNQNGSIAYVNTYCGGNPAVASLNYPQGHGDAWGHYLTALSVYYELFRNPKFTMNETNDVETAQLGGVPVTVNLMHERKFATAAAARAQTGLDIVNLTYRAYYEEDAAKQWYGYYDSNTNRAWGVSEWGVKAGLAAYCDWVTANAVLPHVDTNAADTGIQKVDRTTVTELTQLASTAADIQSQLDNADQGLNPLGVAKNIVPLDIDPSQLTQPQAQTHFEQIYTKAVQAMNNLLAVFNVARQATDALRQQADTVQQFQNQIANQEADYNNQLITIFGTPYPEDPNYPQGYNGPDINCLDFNYIDYTPITGVPSPTASTLTHSFFTTSNATDGSVILITNTVTLNLADDGLEFVKPLTWSTRASPGTIQKALSDLLQAHQKVNIALAQYDALLEQIQDQVDLLESQYGVNASQINLLNSGLNTQTTMDQAIYGDRQTEIQYNADASEILNIGNAMATMLPLSVGLSDDATSAIRGAIQLVAAQMAASQTAQSSQASLAELQAQQDQQLAQAANNIQITLNQQTQGISNEVAQLQQLVRQEPIQRLQLDNLLEGVTEAAENYRSTLGQGLRVLDNRTRFRAQTALQVQEYRYKDMAFRIFRDDGLQKFYAQFDMAALYVYLAAKAYDFETCFLPTDSRGPGENFMREIVRTRAIGQISNGQPVPAGQSQSGGDPGLADPLATMWQNWTTTIKGELGINNPDRLSERFSLRSELFRVQTNLTSAAAGKLWRQVLTQAIVPDLFAVPEFQRYCSPPIGATSPCPAIVLFFSTTVKAGENFFGWPLGGGDSYFNPSAYSTRVSANGVWFDNYDTTALPNTPYIYLVPVGDDLFYAPGSVGVPRQFTVFDQALPAPLQLNTNSPQLSPAFPNWIPISSATNGGLQEVFGKLRQFDEFQAYPDSGQWPEQANSTSRLIGRSVWNTRWMLIIPSVSLAGGDTSTLQRGLQTFVNGVDQDGNGVSDIKLLFQAYTYTGQ